MSPREDARPTEELAAEVDKLPGEAAAEHAKRVRVTPAGLEAAAAAVEASWHAMPKPSLAWTYVPFPMPISTSLLWAS